MELDKSCQALSKYSIVHVNKWCLLLLLLLTGCTLSWTLSSSRAFGHRLSDPNTIVSYSLELAQKLHFPKTLKVVD